MSSLPSIFSTLSDRIGVWFGMSGVTCYGELYLRYCDDVRLCTVEIIVYVDDNVDVGIRMALFVLFVVAC